MAKAYLTMTMPETIIRCDRCGKIVAKDDERKSGYSILPVFRPVAQPDITYCTWECAAPL